MTNLTHKQFKESLIKDLSGIYPGASLTSVDMKKPRGLSYTGISFIPASALGGPVINTDQFYEEYRRTRDYESCLETVRSFIEESLQLLPRLSAETMLNYEAIKKHLVLQLLSVDGNEALLETLPHREICDMALCCRFLFDPEAGQSHSLLVTKEVLKELAISEETLFNDALHYGPLNRPFTLSTMEEVIRGVDSSLSLDGPLLPIYVASTEGMYFGASVLAYPGFLEHAAHVLGGSYYVIPSSIHELLLVPEEGDFDPEGLHAMLCDVNDYEVEEADLLSYTLYLYDEDEKQLQPVRTRPLTGERYS